MTVMLELPPDDLTHPVTGAAIPHQIIAYQGVERYFVLISHSPSPLALVVLLHGFSSNATAVYSQWRTLVDASDFAVLIPQGMHGFDSNARSWNAGVCCGFAKERNLDDVGLIRAMVASVWQTNPSLARLGRKAFVMGSSNGGFLAQLVALNAEKAVDGFDFVAGAVSVAGEQFEAARYPAQSRRAVPVLMLHGQRDTVVRFTGCCNATGQHCCCGIGASTTQCTSTPQVFDRWKALHACNLSTNADNWTAAQGGFTLSGSECKATTRLGVFPGGTHSLIVSVPSVAAVVEDFLRAEACAQLKNGGCSASSAANEEDAAAKVVVLALVVGVSLLLWCAVRWWRRAQVSWELLPNPVNEVDLPE